MSLVEIYYRQTRIAIEKIERNFFVMESLSGELFWQADPQSGDKVGEIKIWVQHADTAPRILGVLPDWQLVVDGVPMEARFYDSIENLKDKIVELQYKKYRFEFFF